MKKKIQNFRPLIFSLVFAFLAWLTIWFLTAWDLFTDKLYPTFYASLYPLYTNVFGWIPFSVGDVFYFILGLLLLWAVILGVRCFVLGQKWRGIRILSRLITSVTIFYLLFHVIWGFNYYKPNLLQQYKVEKYDANELKPIANDLLEKCIVQRNSSEEDKNGVFEFQRNEFNAALGKKMVSPTNIQLPFTQFPKKNIKKYSLYSVFMRYLGVAGYYNPFTAEAQITSLSPDSSVPFSMAHEQAHQMGYAPEYEANFVGYLTCLQSKDTELQYSANYKALKYVLRGIYLEDSIFVKQKIEAFSPAMQRDYEAEKTYYKKYSGTANDAFSAMNDAYLKANRQDGIESYNRFVELLVGYYRNK